MPIAMFYESLQLLDLQIELHICILIGVHHNTVPESERDAAHLEVSLCVRLDRRRFQ